MLDSVVKSHPIPPKSFTICRSTIRKNNPLSFQHFRDPLGSADSKVTSTPLDSALVDTLLLTPLESALTKNRDIPTPPPRGFLTRFPSLPRPFHSSAHSRKVSPIYSIIYALLCDTPGVSAPNFSKKKEQAKFIRPLILLSFCRVNKMSCARSKLLSSRCAKNAERLVKRINTRESECRSSGIESAKLLGQARSRLAIAVGLSGCAGCQNLVAV